VKYGITFLVLAGAWLTIAVLYGGLAWLLAWLGLSFGAVGLAYLQGSAAIFGKQASGSRRWIATLILWPYFAFTHVVYRLQNAVSREPPWHHVNERLTIGRRLDAVEYPSDVTHICDLTAEFCDPVSIRQSLTYLTFPILDAGSVAPADLLRLARELRVAEGDRMLIHCANGHGRTGMVAAVWLMVHGFATTVDEAVQMIQRARPQVKLNRRQRAAIEGVSRLLQADGKT
jgi:protein-tyrosine phosphatase